MAEHGHPGDDWAEDDPSARGTWLVGWLGVFLVVVAVAGIAGLYYAVEQSSARRILSASGKDAQVLRLHREQLKLLRTSGEIDHPVQPGERVRVLDIDKAMHEIVKEYSRR